MTLVARYRDRLANPVPPGCGCHLWIFSVANLGVLAGKDPDEIHSDLRRVLPQGTRRIPDREIQDAIRKAMADLKGGTFAPRPRPAPAIKDGKTALQRILSQGTIGDEGDLWEASPIRLTDGLQGDPVLLLETLYDSDALLWIGDRQEAGIIGQTIRPALEWIDHFRSGGPVPPHFVINPLSGSPAPKKSGEGETLRGDGCVASFKYCLMEFDNLTKEEQVAFWSSVKLPIIALIDSGGKSIHALLEVAKMANVTTLEQWESEIKIRLYEMLLKPLGVDVACSNASRLSRLPGHFRAEKGRQRLLWLSPEGRSIQC